MLKKSRFVFLTAVLGILVVVFIVIRVNTYYTWERRLLVRISDIFEDHVCLASCQSEVDPSYLSRYDFTEDWFTSNIPIWEKALSRFRGQPNVHYLEVGLYEGRSAIWMLENVLTHPSAHLTGVDLFDSVLKQRFLANIKRSGSEDKVTTIVGCSQLELRKLPVDSFDIVYIDGSHRADDVLEDAVLSWRLLKAGGVLIFDDYRWKLDGPPEIAPKMAIDIFLKLYGKHFNIIHKDYQVILVTKTYPLSGEM